MTTENTIIIGGGPAGLAAAIYTARAELNPLVIAGSPPGGQLTLTSDVENYPGFESVLGPELIMKMRTHAQKFGTRFIDDNVKRVDFSKKPYSLFLSNGDVLQTNSVIITTGASALWLGLENEQRLRGRGVSACATCDGFFFKNKTVAVVGGGDTAMEEANFLTKFATKVYLIHRKEEFRASKIMQSRVFENSKIEVVRNAQVVDVLGQDKVEGLQLKTTSPTDDTSRANDNQPATNALSVDGLFLAIGHKPDTEFLKNSGVILDQKGYIKTASWAVWEQYQNPNISYNISKTKYQSATNIDGVFAAGDCVDYAYRQAATAVGMGVAAALEVERYLADNNK